MIRMLKDNGFVLLAAVPAALLAELLAHVGLFHTRSASAAIIAISFHQLIEHVRRR